MSGNHKTNNRWPINETAATITAEKIVTLNLIDVRLHAVILKYKMTETFKDLFSNFLRVHIDMKATAILMSTHNIPFSI